MFLVRALVWFVCLLATTAGAFGQTTPVPAPLTGTVTPNAWQAFDSSYPGITLACGKPFHYIVAQPPQYNGSLYKYPLYIWLHPTYSGNSWYLGDNNPLKLAGTEPGDYNTTAFQTRHPAFYVAPSADQTNGNGSTGSCNNQADDGIENWGGWFNNGSTGSGTHYSGDTGPNTFAIVAMINELKTKYSIDPARIYINGFSLGGIYTDYACYHYNAYTGDLGKIFAACAGSAGVNQANAPPSSAAIAAMQNVPQWMFSGSNDGASPPGSWNTPLCSGLGGNPSNLTAITSATTNRCGSSQMRYTLCPSCGHQDTDANGAGVWSNQVINDFLFAQSAPVAAPTTGKFKVSGGKIIDPNGKQFVAHGINLGTEQLAIAITNAAAQPLTTLFPHINFVRVTSGASSNAGTSSAVYPNPAIYATYAKILGDLGIVMEIEDHSSNGGQWPNYVPGPLSGTPSYPPTGAALTTYTNFWKSLAQLYKANPYVWIGSFNEINSGDGTYSTSAVGAVTTYEDALYQAVRSVSSDVIIEMGNGVGGGNAGTVGSNSGQITSLVAKWSNIVWYMHSYIDNGTPASTLATNQGSAAACCGGSGGSGYIGAQTLQSADGIVPVIFDEWGAASGNAQSADATSQVSAMTTMHGLGIGSAAWQWFPSIQWQMVNNGNTAAGPFSLTTWGQEVSNFLASQPAPTPPSTSPVETLALSTIATVPQNTAFTVSGTISGLTAAPSLQYQDNGGSWTALPAGSSVTATNFSFSHPGMAANPAATVSVRDGNNTSITATGPPFIVKGPESPNNTTTAPGAVTFTPNFSDNFATLSLHRTWQAGDKWQLVAPDTPDGRGGPNFGEAGTQWWVNPFNPSTPISGIYTASGGLQLGLIATPSAQAAYINAQSGTTLPYVGALLNTSQTSYQKYGYWEFTGVTVPRINGVTFEVSMENVQITGTWPPEIDLRIYTDGSNVQTVLFQTNGGGQSYTTSSSQGFNAAAAHTYGISWQPSGIIYYIDGGQVGTSTLPSAAYTTDPMFMFLLSGANYVNTVNPAVGSLPTHVTVGGVNVYPAKPGSGPSDIITDANGNTFQILADGTISINAGTVSTISSNVVQLAYVNHVVWQRNSAGNWYSYLGGGNWSAPTTTSPLTGVTETLSVGTVGQQVANQAFTLSGTIGNATVAPSLQYQDNTGAWQALPAGATVSTTAWSFSHPALPAGQYTVSIRDANSTGITASSNSFAVVLAAGEAISLSPIANQQAGQTFTVTGTIVNAPGSGASTNWIYNPGQDGSYWKKPFQSSANWITSGPLITTLRGGTPSMNIQGNYTVPWYIGRAADPLVTVTQGSKSIQVHLPLGAIAETPTSAVDQSIGGVDESKPYLAWSISGATINTGSVQASGSVITGSYGLTVEDGAGLFMVDAATGVPGSMNAAGGINDYELEQIEADKNYVIQHMLGFSLDTSQASSAGPIWPLNLIDTSGPFTGNIPQGITIGIPASTPRPIGKSRGFYALWDQMQQFGGLNYNFGATGGVNLGIYDIAGTHTALINDMVASWPAVAANLAILNYANGVAGAQYSLATTKGAVPGSTDAYSPPPPLDLSPTGGVNVAPSTFGAWYPNTSYTATPTNPGVQTGVPTLEYQDGGGAWLPLPSGATVTATTFSFTHGGMPATSSGVISVRDSAHPTVIAVSNTFVVASTAVETISVNTIGPQLSNTAFTISGLVSNITAAPSLQYQDNGGSWSPLPSGALINFTPGNSATIILASTPGASFVDGTGGTWTIVSGQAMRNGSAAGTTANVTELALVSGVVWAQTSSEVPPAVASAVGYNTRTFGPGLTLGQNWTKFSFFGTSIDTLNITQNPDQSITLLPSSGATYGNSASSAQVIPGNTTNRLAINGIAFGGGAYFEADMAINGPASFWANDIESMNGGSIGLGVNPWPGQTQPYGDWIETDFAEFDTTAVYGGAIHNWYSTATPPAIPPTADAVSGSSFSPSPTPDYTQRHKYGFLWVPATGSAGAPSNILPNSTLAGAVVGTIGSGGSLPTGWTIPQNDNLTTAITATGTDGTTGKPFIRLHVTGTPTGGDYNISVVNPSVTGKATWSYNFQASVAVFAGSLANISSPGLIVNNLDNSNNYLSGALYYLFTPTGTLAPFTGSFVSAANAQKLGVGLSLLGPTVGQPVDVTLQIENPQLLEAAAPTGTQGYAKFLFDGKQVGNTMFWNKYNSALAPPPAVSDGSATSVMDTLHLGLILGTGVNPTDSNHVYGVSVWQASAANDISNIPAPTPATNTWASWSPATSTWLSGANPLTGTTTPGSATFSFTHPIMTASASNTVSVRDASATSILGSSNAFLVRLPESANNTVVTTVGPQIIDASGEAFAINPAGQVTVNGFADTTTANVVALAYVNSTVWQRNSAGLWYSKTISTAAWSSPGTLTSPLPPEALGISAIGAQTVGVPFAISGTVASALVAPSLQYSVSGGPWVAFPAGSSVSTSAWSLTVPAIATAGAATISVRDAGTPSITAVSNSFSVSAAPVEQLAISTIADQTQNVAFRVTGTITNASTIPTLQYAINGGAYQALPNGSPASLVTQSSFAFTVPGITSTGTTTVSVRDANATSITAVSNSFQVGVPVGESLSLQPIGAQFAGTPFVVTGAVLNASSVRTLQYAVSAGAYQALPAGATVTQSGFSFTVPGLSVGQATISVRDAGTPSITATSNSFQIQAVGTETLTVNAIGAQPVGIPFSVSGTITNVTAAPSLQYADNGGNFQALPAGSTVTQSAFSFAHPGLGASQGMTVVVRDSAHPSVTASSPVFIILARESPNLTTVTTVGPQIIDSSGTAYTLTQGAQVARNGIPDASTGQVIEIAYVNRQVWYENANLQWWALSTVGSWGPTGGTTLGPLPSSKANIYLTSTARLAVVVGFNVAVPGVVVNDTIVGGSFTFSATSTNGTLSMPSASGTGTNSLRLVSTLAGLNQALSGLQFTGRTIGTGTVALTVTDSAQSVARASVNIAVVRAAPVIIPGR